MVSTFVTKQISRVTNFGFAFPPPGFVGFAGLAWLEAQNESAPCSGPIWTGIDANISRRTADGSQGQDLGSSIQPEV